MKKNIVFMILFMCANLFLSGCLTLEKMSILYDINKNLTGRVELSFIGIHSDEETEAEKKNEMTDLYNSYVDDGKDMASIYCLDDVKTELTDKTDFKCNAIVTGKIKTFLGSIYPLTDDSVYEIKKDNKQLSVKIDSCNISDEDMPVEVSIRFKGKILSHNAHLFDEKNNKMTWSGQKMNETGISFVLAIEK